MLKSLRISTIKTVGVTAALAVFGSVLVATPASAVSDEIGVTYWVTSADSAYVCVDLYGGDSLASFPDVSTPATDDFTYTDVEEALTIDTDNSGELAEATIDYVGDDTENCNGWEFAITEIYVGDWNEINFRFDAWITSGGNDQWAEGSTNNHRYVQTYEGNPNWTYDVWTSDINDNSYSSVGLAHNNNYISDERHSAFYCLENDDYQEGWVDDLGDDNDDWSTRSENVVGDPIVYVYDLTLGEFVADNTGNEDWDITITNADDIEASWQHCGGYDREFWIEGLELGHTYEFQSQYEVETHMTWDDGNSDGYTNDYVYTLGFDRSVNFTPLDVRQNLVSVLPTDNDGQDGDNNYWWEQQWLDGGSGAYWNEFSLGDAESLEDEHYTNVDVILPEMQGTVDGNYDGPPALGSDDIQDKWYVSDSWSGNDWNAYYDDDAGFMLYDGNDWLWDSQGRSTCEVNGADVNNYDENAAVCDYYYGTNWYDNRGNNDMFDEGDWGHLRNFNGQAFVDMIDWQNDSEDWVNDYQDDADVFQGMSNSYSSTWNYQMQTDYVRATGSDSIQLALSTDVGYDYWCTNDSVEESLDVEDSNATFHIRLLPNYGQDAYTDASSGYQNGTSEDGMDNYSGNESYPESRLFAVDYTFEPGDYYFDGNNIYNCSGDEKSNVVFDLTSYDQDEDGTLEPWETLEPGTTYSVEVMATFDRIEDSNTNQEFGDGGYDFVSFNSFRNSYASTYLESHVDVLSETSAKFEVNLQDSHYTDRYNLDQAGYLAWNECTDVEGSPDCNSYVPGTDSSQSFNIGDINRLTLSSDASVEFIDGDKHFVFTRNDLNADTSYQAVFAMDYWQTVSPLDSCYMDEWWCNVEQDRQASLRKEMEDTLDYTNCDSDAFSSQESAWLANGTDCYNSTTKNDLFRSDVAYFRTFGSPELDVVSTVDNDAAQDGTDTNTDITLEFSENVVAGSGLIQIVRSSDDKVVQTLRPSASSNVAIDGNVVTIMPGKNFDYSTSYYVYVGAGAFEDEDGVAFAGNDNSVTTFTTEDKPAEIGSVDIQMLGNFKRTISVNLVKAAAFETVQVWWHEHQSSKLFYAGSITLDENGDGDFTRVLPRLGMMDNVIVTHGRHTVASQMAATS